MCINTLVQLNKLASVTINITESVNLEMSQGGIIVLVLFVVTALLLMKPIGCQGMSSDPGAKNR